MIYKLKKYASKLWIKIGLFVVTAAILVELFPHENKFNYHFVVGKPWQYDQLTASFDFPVYKDEKQLKTEQDSVLRNYTPYYQFDNQILSAKLQLFNEQGSVFQSLDDSYRQYVEKQLNIIYNRGIIQTDDFGDLEKNRVTTVSIIKTSAGAKPGEAVKTPLNTLFTVKSAYAYIVNNAPASLNAYVLQSSNLNLLLEENLRYDASLSEQMKNELLRSVSLTEGMKQAGEKIIDRGTIVTESTYRVLNSLGKAINDLKRGESRSWSVFAGEILIVSVLMTLLFFYLYLFRRQVIFKQIKNILFFLMMIIIMVGGSFLITTYTNSGLYLVPFALLPIMICTFFDSRSALFAHIITISLVSFVVTFSPFEFVILQIIAGMTVICSLRDLTQRSQLVQTAGLIFLAYSIGYLGITLTMEQGFDKIDWSRFLIFGISSLLLLFAYAFIYIIEKLFGFLSNVTLVELSNVNNKLLTQFAEQAPGSFQHSLQVSNLATEAAQKIHANPLLVRTGALYHDIGKMANASYFTENQINCGNVLESMSDEDAARIIIDHVTEGVRIAEKNNLPKQIITFIRTHHGAGKVKYFYQRFINNHPDEICNEGLFSYPGPNPNTKETALLMMADAVEAASRSLKEYTEETINSLVEKIIGGQILEGAFNHAPITLNDIEVSKTVFKEKLRNIYHSRIAYPEAQKQ